MHTLEAVTCTPQRPDVWSASNAQCRVRYQVLAEAEADLLCRVLNLFAMQYLIPRQVNVLQQDSLLDIAVELDGLSWHRAQVIGEKMRGLISVCSVAVERAQAPSTANTSVALAAG